MGIKEDKKQLDDIREEISDIKEKEGIKHSFAYEILQMQRQQNKRLVIANTFLSIALIITIILYFFK